MTLVNIDLQNAGYETGPDDRVVFYSPANRNEQGTIISTAETSVTLVDGQASKELAPGPVVVQILAQGVADTRPKTGYVPEDGPVSLRDVVLDWTPALVDQGVLAILVAVDEALSRVSGAVAAEIGNTTHVIATGTNVHAGKVVRLNADGKLAIGTGVGEVTAPQDPTNKAYVDTAISSAIKTTSDVNFAEDNRFANLLVRLNPSGKLVIHTAGITGPTDPANKAYVDTGVNKKADLGHKHNGSDIISGTTSDVNFAVDDRFANQLVRLNPSGKMVIHTAGITGPTDPANKAYVDTAVSSTAARTTSWWN